MLCLQKSGFPIEWFVSTPSADFLCGICFEVLKSPHQCKNGHNFCHSCVLSALRTNQECPTCKVSLTSESLCVNLSIRNLINEMLVMCQPEIKCKHATLDVCKWIGSLESSSKHFKSCTHQTMNCPLADVHLCCDTTCTGKLERRNLVHHITSQNKADLVDSITVMSSTITLLNKELELMRNLMFREGTKRHTVSDGKVVFGVKENNVLQGYCVALDRDTGDYNSVEFTNNQKEGFGVARMGNSTFRGEYRNNSKHCGMLEMRPAAVGDHQGEMKSCVYMGEFLNDEIHGHGHVIDGNDRTFVGEFRKGENVWYRGHVAIVLTITTCIIVSRLFYLLHTLFLQANITVQAQFGSKEAMSSVASSTTRNPPGPGP